MERMILHADINHCYANIECLDDPSLRGRPVAVGGDEALRHGIVLAATPEARRCGVKTGQALWQARQSCPELTVVPPRFERYLEVSRQVRAIYQSYTPQVEPFGLDEAWLDVTGCPGTEGGAVRLADALRRRVREEIGVTVSVGVSFNKPFAKLGSELKKPDAVSEVSRAGFRTQVWPMPVSALLYVGRATTARLARYGIHTIGALAQTEPVCLRGWFGKAGDMLSRFANGLDAEPVARADEARLVRSIGSSVTPPRDLRTLEDARIVLWTLCEEVSARLYGQGLAARTVQLSLRDTELFCWQRQTALAQPAQFSGELCRAATELLARSHDWRRPLRSLGVRAMALEAADAPVQLSLFDDGARREKRARLERAVLQARARCGPAAVRRAVTLLDPSLAGLPAAAAQPTAFSCMHGA